MVRFVQAILWIIPTALFLWLLNNELVPSGAFAVERAANGRSPFLDRLLPDARLREAEQDQDGDWVIPIIGDPAFFFAHPHRDFETIEAEVWFKNTGVPIVELGART